jgi:hypothetical protein
MPPLPAFGRFENLLNAQRLFYFILFYFLFYFILFYDTPTLATFVNNPASNLINGFCSHDDEHCDVVNKGTYLVT